MLLLLLPPLLESFANAVRHVPETPIYPSIPSPATSPHPSSPPISATRFTSYLLIYAVMSLSKNPQQMQSEPGPSMPPTAGGTVTAETKLDNAIQHACKMLDAIYKPQSDDEWIRHSLDHVWLTVFTFVQDVGDSNLEKRLRKLSEFKSHVTPGSDQERKLVNLVRSMVKQEAPWRDLLKNGTLLSSLWRQVQ